MAVVNTLVCLSCPIFYLISQVLVAGLKFFLGKDETENQDSDSDSEVSVVIKSSQSKLCHPADLRLHQCIHFCAAEFSVLFPPVVDPPHKNVYFFATWSQLTAGYLHYLFTA